MLKILSIFGTRPEAIKMVPVVRALEAEATSFKSIVCVTGQHRQMLDQVLDLFGISPDHDLNIMAESQSLADITAAVLLGLQGVLNAVRPDLVLVHGDTTTTMAATLAAYYCRIPIGHVEAGLRTGNKYAPFPEEVNRRVTGVVADAHFAPSIAARQNLLREGVADDTIFVVGNTAVDAVMHARNIIESDSRLRARLEERFSFLDTVRRTILVTGHRRENIGADLEQICLALKDLARMRPDLDIVYPVHLNPKIRDAVQGIIGPNNETIHLIEPVDYISFIYLMTRSYLVLTDSGGIQEEAPTLGKPLLVMRSVTERPEAVLAGTARLVGASREKIVTTTMRLLDDPDEYQQMIGRENPYGDGRTARRIVDVLKSLTYGRTGATVGQA